MTHCFLQRNNSFVHLIECPLVQTSHSDSPRRLNWRVSQLNFGPSVLGESWENDIWAALLFVIVLYKQATLQQRWIQSFFFALWPISLIASPFFIVYMTFLIEQLTCLPPLHMGLLIHHMQSLRNLRVQILRDQGDQCALSFWKLN